MGGIQSKRQNHSTHDLIEGIQSKRLQLQHQQPYKENHRIQSKMQNHSTHDLIEGIQSKRLQPSIHVPHDLIEIVLFRLPVKSLLRFRSVCKQWNATISDHSFAKTHLRQSKSSSNKLLANPQLDRSKKGYTHNEATQLVEIKDGELRVLSPVPVYYNPQLEWFKKKVVCHIDGLYLVDDSYKERCNYILFNPSNRTYKILRYPYPHDVYDRNGEERRFGICYNPLVKDYMVVIGDRLHYAIFRCKTESWSSRKKTKDVSSSSGFKPSFYWVFNYYNGGGNPSFWKFEILGFNWRNGKFRHVKIPKPDGVPLMSPVSMSLGGRLCLLPSCEPMISVMNYGIPIWNIGEVGDEWMKLHLTCSWFRLMPLCWTYRNEIVIHETRSRSILHYDVAERKLTRVRNRSSLKRWFSLVPYVENMFVL